MRLKDNADLFSAPRRRPEAHTSWWLCVESRADFQAALEREQARLRRSIGAAMVSGGMVVGHLKNK